MPDIIVPGAHDIELTALPIGAPVGIVDDFLPVDLAEAMRADIDAHFDNPQKHRGETHQVWNYWFVPDLYTYLRTTPEKIIARAKVDAFVGALRDWAVTNMGMGTITWPVLSLYVSGCRQNWHNDAGNGRFAFVYSLTRDERATVGGETLVMREGDPLRNNLTRPTAGSGFYQAIAPRFNRLVVFDDRAAHAVERVDGSMDPVQGRFVLHGHLSEAGIHVSGPLAPAIVNDEVNAVSRMFAEAHAADLSAWHGPLSLRLSIAASGIAEVCDILVDRVVHPGTGAKGWDDLRERLCDHLEQMRFPPAKDKTMVILPILFGEKPRALR